MSIVWKEINAYTNFISAISKDKEMQRVYKDNIAMARYDAIGDKLEHSIKHKLCNQGADSFMENLTKFG